MVHDTNVRRDGLGIRLRIIDLETGLPLSRIPCRPDYRLVARESKGIVDARNALKGKNGGKIIKL